MRKTVLVILSMLLAIPLFSRAIKTNKKAIRALPQKLPRLEEPAYINTFGADHRFGPITQYSDRDSDFFASI